MSLPLLRYLLRRNWLLVLSLAVVPVLIGGILGVLYPTFREEKALLSKMFGFVLNFLGSDVIDPLSPSGFFMLPFVHGVVMFALAIAMAVTAFTLPVGGRGDGSLEHLLAGRLERRTLVWTVLVATIPVAILMGLSQFAGAMTGVVAADVLDEFDTRRAFLVSLNGIVLALFFGALAILLSVTAADRRAAIFRYAALVFASMMLELVATGPWDQGKFLRYFNPFGYFQPYDAMAGVADMPFDGSVLVGASALLVGAAVWLEGRRQAV